MKKFTLLSALVVLFAVNVNAADEKAKETCMQNKVNAVQEQIFKACGLEKNFDYTKLTNENKECLDKENKKHEADFQKIEKECAM